MLYRWLAAIFVSAAFLVPGPARGEDCVRVEAFVRGDSAQSQKAVKFLSALKSRWPGLAVQISDVQKDKDALLRAHQLLQQYQIKTPGVPIVHAAGQLLVGYRDDASTGQQIEDMLTIHAYTREGCPHCAKAKRFLAKMKQKYPGFHIQIHEITRDPNALAELQDLTRRHNMLATSVPVLYFCGQIMVGYDEDETTGVRIEDRLRENCVRCEDGPPLRGASDRGVMTMASYNSRTETGSEDAQPETEPGNDEPSLEEVPLTELPEADNSGPTVATAPKEERPHEIELPWFGTVSAEAIGMPLFTIAVGLVDGFNPCAMWVLLFLLSVLVNLHDRWKILAVAGTFVVISGLAYFAFMAAWLNVFLFVGYLRAVQIALGVLALFVGSVHVKDFFAFHQGVSLSIPDSAKPGIYARVRGIVTAQHLWGALIGASVLAVLVNIIELLCTAGLPALYTQILMLQKLPAWENYLYLALYNVAYMFDDSVMVAVVVVTLGRRKLQQQQGRWLKLVSGLVIVLLGLVLLFKPAWLI